MKGLYNRNTVSKHDRQIHIHTLTIDVSFVEMGRQCKSMLLSCSLHGIADLQLAWLMLLILLMSPG